MIMQMEISLLIRLIISHLLCDFVFQSDSMVNRKYAGVWKSKHLYLYGAFAGFLAYLFSGLWESIWIVIVVATTHILIDGVKTKFKNDIESLLIDQLAHFVILVFIWIVIINPKSEDMAVLMQVLLPGTRMWVIIAAYIIILWPSSKLISKLTEKLREGIENKELENDSLEKAGTWIGWLERFLILTFVLLNQYGAIGLLVAAKSIFRFSETRKVGEYVLIGTLVSFSIAILVGLVAGMFL